LNSYFLLGTAATDLRGDDTSFFRRCFLNLTVTEIMKIGRLLQKLSLKKVVHFFSAALCRLYMCVCVCAHVNVCGWLITVTFDWHL